MKAKREAELRALAKLEKDREERGHADELAGALNEFFSALYVQDMVEGFDDRVSNTATAGSSNSVGNVASDFPLASPDSITVTTEFGVVEESGNVTIISASGPSPHHQAFDQETEEENNVEMTEDVHNDLPELQASLSPLQLDTQTQATAEVDLMADASGDEDTSDTDDGDPNDTGEDADIDTDGLDADAEGAIIEEFMDHDDEWDVSGGNLTPTTTSAAT